MTIEINLLKALSNKDNLNNYQRLLNTKTLSVRAIEILKDYQRYFETYPTHMDIDWGVFREFFFIQRHPNLDEESDLVYTDIINQLMSKEIDSCTNIISAFEQKILYEQLDKDIQNNIAIEDIKNKVDVGLDKINALKGTQEAVGDDMDLREAMTYTDRSKGLKWRLNCLNELFQGGLIKGDFGIIAGFVDMGKTGFLCSEVSYMAQQLEGDQWIAWLNTEGNWQQILPRLYSSTLNVTHQDLSRYTDKATEKYLEKMKGDKNRIKVLNFQRKSTKDVERLIKNNPPSLIVFDLLDHIRGFDRLVGSEGNVTERYNALYQWAREVATSTCPILAISQLNGDGNNEPYPSITNLRGSRVDKQAAASFQLIIGGKEGNSTERFLSMPKNKISSNKGWRQQVRFDPLRNRFID